MIRPGVPTLAAYRPEDLRTLAPPADATVGYCAGCQAHILLSPDCRRRIRLGLYQAVCYPCASFLPGLLDVYVILPGGKLVRLRTDSPAGADGGSLMHRPPTVIGYHRRSL